jgi:hypothetical protein
MRNPEMTEDIQKNPGLSRRTVVKGAAWSVPVIAAAVATPLAAASTDPGRLIGAAWTATQTGLLSLNLLDSSSLLNAQALITVPTELTLTNGPTAINDTAAITISVARPSGINIPVGRARGFGVHSFQGAVTPASARTAAYQSASIIGQYGFPATTYVSTFPVVAAANTPIVIPVQFGLAGVSTGVAISLLSSFAVTATITIGADSFTAISTISVPVGAGIL